MRALVPAPISDDNSDLNAMCVKWLRELRRQVVELKEKYAKSQDRYDLGAAEQTEAAADRLKKILMDYVATLGPKGSERGLH